jgi:hypothetical protein
MQGWTDHELELSFRPTAEQVSRRADSREQSGDENVRVEQDPHALRASGLVLLLHGNAHRLVLVEVGARPDALEHTEAKVAAKRFLDHLAVTTPGSSRLNPNGSKHALIKRHGGASLWHNCIIAS